MTVFLDTPVAAGSVGIPLGQSGSDHGYAVLTQTTTLAVNGANAVSHTFTVPKNSQLLDFLCDTTTVWNSGDSDTLSVGTSAAGTQYASGVSTASTGRVRPTFTAAQLAAMANVGSNTSVVATVTPAGTTATTGSTIVTMVYVMKETGVNT